MKIIYSSVAAALLLLGTSCGKVQEQVAEVTNPIELQGRWLVSESDHGGTPVKLIENESLVLTFKDGKAAFAPTDSIKGLAVYTAVHDCTKGPRDFRAEGNDIVFSATPNCAESRITIQQVDASTLKFPDPSDTNVVRVLRRINEDQYLALVKESDRKI